MPGRNQRGWRRRTPGRPEPAPPIDAETARHLDRIAEIARNVRATWFILLGVLAFAGVTLLGVEDADFFAVGRQTALPLVGVEIPTRSFFRTAPVSGCRALRLLPLSAPPAPLTRRRGPHAGAAGGRRAQRR
jgi:hypothetical protein